MITFKGAFHQRNPPFVQVSTYLKNNQVNREQILAHRGWWKSRKETNSLEALRNALQAGFGLETDFRDHNGRLVVSHDPPAGETLLGAAELFVLYARIEARGRLALNVKSDGLQKLLAEAIDSSGIDRGRVFAFDMSIPDALGYLQQRFPTYTRVSEYEEQPAFIDKAGGVWVDSFTGQFPQVKIALQFLRRGLRVAVVSSELHRRDPGTLWDEIEGAELHHDPRFELCTDFPEKAFDRFGTKK